MNVDNIDKYNHCCVCHKNMTIERVVDNQVMVMFIPDKDEAEFMLDDGSRMRVCMCKKCKEENDLDDPDVQAQIMEAVINGWQLEVDAMILDKDRPDWTVEKGKAHMDIYSKRTIILKSEGIEKYHIDDRIKKIQDMKLEALIQDGIIQ